MYVASKGSLSCVAAPSMSRKRSKNEKDPRILRESRTDLETSPTNTARLMKKANVKSSLHHTVVKQYRL